MLPPESSTFTTSGWWTAFTNSAFSRSTMGRGAQITMLHHPPILITDVL